KDLAEVLSAVPSAVVQDSGGAGQRKTVSLRGAAPNATLVLLDGVPLAGPGMAMDLGRVPLGALRRVDVLRGGASSRYGPGAMGGVINLVTLAPEGRRVFAETSFGSFGTARLQAGGAAPVLGGDALVALHGLRTLGDFGFDYDAQPTLEGPLERLPRANNHALQGGGLLRYRARVLGGTVDVLGEGLAETRGLAGTAFNPTPDATQQTGRGTLSARLLRPFLTSGELSVLAWSRLDDTTLRGSPFGGTAFSQLESSFGAEVMASQLVASRHGLTALLSAGGDFLREPTGRDPSWGRFGVMLADEVTLLDGRVSLLGAARVDVTGPFAVVSPKAGVTAQLPASLRVSANVGQAARAPSFVELYVVQGTLSPNLTLQPERALTADATLAWSHRRGKASVTGFGALYDNLISYEYYPPALAKPYNIQGARVAGVEVEASATPWPWLEATASYTLMGTQNLRGDPRYFGKALPNRPQHRLAARVVGGVPLLHGRAEVAAQSAQFLNRTETLSAPARAFINLGIATTPWKNPSLTVSLDVKNLLDVSSFDLDGYPLPPRAVSIALAGAWDFGSRP
ncbi:MAG: TonB-dependent receptor, partial [Archangium sp.]|nr:TonB-dependent receptor [Archangium sp.]